MPAISEAWLALVREDIIDADLPICDPHHHLWDNPQDTYLLAQLIADTDSGHNVVSTVFVECASMYRNSGCQPLRPLGETEFVNGIAAMSASGGYGDMRACKGIVGFADLTLGAEVGIVLDEHMRLSDRFRGIRHAAGWDESEKVRNSHTRPTQNLLLQDDFQRGIEQLERRGLSFDAWLFHPQIPQLTELARNFPNITIILNHFGGPLGIGPYKGHGDEIYAQWCVDVGELAKCPNVSAKLGGIVMPLSGYGWHKRDKPASSDEIVAATSRYHLKAIDLFGPERCMFESNFPVDKYSCSYHVLWNAFKKITSNFSLADRQLMFHDTAAQVYRLGEMH